MDNLKKLLRIEKIVNEKEIQIYFTIKSHKNTKYNGS